VVCEDLLSDHMTAVLCGSTSYFHLYGGIL